MLLIMKTMLLTILVCLTSYYGLAAAAGEPLTLAVHPYLPVPEIQSRFGPFANYLARALDRPVSVRVGGSYNEHIKTIGTDQVDIAFLGPVSYIHVTQQYGPKPLLARFQVGTQPFLYGVIATRKESAIRSLGDLKDMRFAFVAPESTMGYIVPHHMLKQAGLPGGAPARQQFLGSHYNVAIGILVGDYDAGAMKKEVYEEFEAKGLRALAVSPGVPDHLFVTRANLPHADVQRLQQAMLQLKNQPDGAVILDKLQKGLTALIPASNMDYDGLRTMVLAIESTAR